MLLETGTAQHGAALRGLEWHRGRFAALRTGSTRFRPNPSATGALGLALLAALGVVLELFVVEEKLLAGGENEFSAAIDTLEYAIRKFHGRLPERRENK
jgi:hypothetical protein